jgi:hypothetical protein
MKILGQMEKVRAKAQQAIGRGEEPGEDLERELDSLMSSVQQNAAYQRVVVAQENFDKLMAKANSWILEGIKAGAASPIITLA